MITGGKLTKYQQTIHNVHKFSATLQTWTVRPPKRTVDSQYSSNTTQRFCCLNTSVQVHCQTATAPSEFWCHQCEKFSYPCSSSQKPFPPGPASASGSSPCSPPLNLSQWTAAADPHKIQFWDKHNIPASDLSRVPPSLVWNNYPNSFKTFKSEEITSITRYLNRNCLLLQCKMDSTERTVRKMWCLATDKKCSKLSLQSLTQQYKHMQSNLLTLVTTTFLSCPRRWQRSIHCSSVAGFHA